MKTITVQSSQNKIEVEFQLSSSDVSAAERLWRRKLKGGVNRQRRPYVILAAALLLAAGGVAVLLAVVPRSVPVVVAAALTAASLLLLAGGYLWHRWEENRWLGAIRDRSTVKQRWIASPDGLCRVKRGVRTEIPWSAIARIQRLGEALAIFVDPMECYVIPDRAFLTERQQVRFLKLVQARLKGSQRPDNRG